MNRRKLFSLIPAALAATAVPALASMEPVPDDNHRVIKYLPDTVVPSVWLARSERDELTQHWLETWRHTTDRDWIRQLYVSDREILDGFSYEERYAHMRSIYRITTRGGLK